MGEKLIEGLDLEIDGQPAETQETELAEIETAPQEQSDGTPQVEGQPEAPDDQARINYEYQAKKLQSLADKFENLDPEQVERLIQLNRQLQDGLAPEISEYIKTKQTKLKNTDEFGLEVPQKPSDYDPVLAVTDPESDSAKYKESLMEYKFERKLSERDAKLAKERSEHEQVESRRQMVDELHSVHKFSDKDIGDLETFIANPETYTTENMVKFYSLLKSKKNPAEQKLTKEFNTIQRNRTIPQPLGNIQGQAPSTKTDGQLVAENILEFGNRNLNP